MVKVGLAVITYNRLDYLKKCLTCLYENSWGGAQVRLIVDDCSTDGTKEWLQDQDYWTVFKDKNYGVAHSKNTALKAMMDEGCDYMFVLEDDILMLDPKTCIKYIGYAIAHGLDHMNFALHGPLNKGRMRMYKGICTYPDSVGAFSLYTKECINSVGYLDENFKNAWEHVEHTYRIAEAGLTTPFWWFADHPDSAEMLTEIPGSIDNSSIRPRDDWKQNIDEGREYFIKKHGHWLPPRQ
jgi:GT2 family glycosyltransferase